MRLPDRLFSGRDQRRAVSAVIAEAVDLDVIRPGLRGVDVDLEATPLAGVDADVGRKALDLVGGCRVPDALCDARLLVFLQDGRRGVGRDRNADRAGGGAAVAVGDLVVERSLAGKARLRREDHLVVRRVGVALRVEDDGPVYRVRDPRHPQDVAIDVGVAASNVPTGILRTLPLATVASPGRRPAHR